MVHQGSAPNSQKQLLLFKVASDPEKEKELPELYFIIKNFKSKLQETIVEFEQNQIVEFHTRFKDQGKMTFQIVQSEEDVQTLHEMKVNKQNGVLQ